MARAAHSPDVNRLLRSACIAIAVLLLASCGHSRVVRRDYEAPGRAASPAAQRAASRGAIEPLPRGGVHIVRAGETLYGISFRYGLRYQDVGAWNGIADPYVIEIGQRLHLRPGGTDSTPIAAGPAPPRASLARPPIPRPGPRPPGSPPLPPRGALGPPLAGAPPPPVAPSPSGTPSISPSAGAPDWRWPTRGQVVGRYVAGDQLQQGINIAGSAGQPVQAAGDGVVVYSGAGLVGYGELIIIKHNDEWLSAYAHNRRRLVNEGTRVHAGDTIAEMGHTGASRDMLHFEIRRNGKPVDPQALLPQH